MNSDIEVNALNLGEIILTANAQCTGLFDSIVKCDTQELELSS